MQKLTHSGQSSLFHMSYSAPGCYPSSEEGNLVQSICSKFSCAGEDCHLMNANKRFRLVLIKPSHYDNDGYVIRWWRGGLPSNSLACLYGIALECRERRVLGADFDIDIEAIVDVAKA